MVLVNFLSSLRSLQVQIGVKNCDFRSVFNELPVWTSEAKAYLLWARPCRIQATEAGIVPESRGSQIGQLVHKICKVGRGLQIHHEVSIGRGFPIKYHCGDLYSPLGVFPWPDWVVLGSWRQLKTYSPSLRCKGVRQRTSYLRLYHTVFTILSTTWSVRIAGVEA